MDGVEALQEIRKINQDVPVILSSGYSEQEATKRLNLSDFSGFVQKPYLPQTLVKRVNEILCQSKDL